MVISQFKRLRTLSQNFSFKCVYLFFLYSYNRTINNHKEKRTIMAYMNQEKKKEIASLLKMIIPRTWKYTLSVDNHSTIVLNIRSADFDLCEMIYQKELTKQHSIYGDLAPIKREYYSPYHHRIVDYFDDITVKGIFEGIVQALNLKNYDNSDAMTDYFDVGHYVRINIGQYNNPFVFVE